MHEEIDTTKSHRAVIFYLFAENSLFNEILLKLASHRRQASQNSTLRNFVLPGPIITKLGMIDYVGDTYSYANFT